MINYYITEFTEWLNKVMPELVNEKNFLLLMGSLFLLGVVTKWIVVMNYGRLIRKAENMTNPKNATLRQIKMKFDSVKQVNGHVANPMLLVKRHLNRCKVGIISLNKLDNIINWCTIMSVCVAGLVGLWLYNTKADYMIIVAYIGTGCFFGFALEMINRCTGVKELQTELAYVIVDFLENSAIARDERQNEVLIDLASEEERTNKEQINSGTDSVFLQEEQILNQVIGEFLQ